MTHIRCRRGWTLGAVAWLAAAGMASAGEARLTEQGIELSMGAPGELVVQYPSIRNDADQVLGRIVARAITENGARAAIRYDNGLVVHFERQKPGLLHMRFENPPAGFTRYRFEMTLPLGPFAGVGSFTAGDAAPKEFPGQKAVPWALFQGNARDWTFSPKGGDPVRFVNWPDGSWGQIQDNREWHTQNFLWFLNCPRYADHPFTPLDFGSDPAAAATPLAARPDTVIDAFGQDFVKDFPGKVKDEAELKADAATEADYYARFAMPERDPWGGLPGSGETMGFKKTGFFHVEQKGDRWHLVDPDGNLFHHLGLCGFQPGDDYTYTQERPAGYFEWLPAPNDPTFRTAWRYQDNWWKDKAFSFYLANVIRKYGQPIDENENEWTRRMIERVRPMGFTSIGAFTGIRQSARDLKFPYTSILPGGGPELPGARGFWDPFDPESETRLDRNFANGAAKNNADDPLVIGYYLANEQGAEDLPRALPALPATHAAKRAFVDRLKAKYKTVAAFNEAWGRDDASFDAVAAARLVATTRPANADVAAFVAEFFERYYKLIHDTFRKYDKNHMLIGSRWQPGTANNEALVRACAKYNDVISLNYYTTGFDKTYVDRLRAWAGGKPFIFSEWHYSSPSDTGLPGGLGQVASQAERTAAYRHYVEQSASWGYVVGSEWFILLDQARGGRFFEKLTGEKGNTGFFSVTDRPYRELCEGAFETHKRIYDVLLGKVEPYVFDDPRFVAKGGATRTASANRVAAPLELDGSANGWPGVPPELIGLRQHVLGIVSEPFAAAFRLAWDDTTLYFFADVTDTTPRVNGGAGENLWNGDGVELFIGAEELDEPGQMRFGDRQVLLGAGRGPRQVHVRNSPTDVDATLRSVVVDKPDGRGYLLEAAIPFAALGVERPAAGMELLFNLALDDAETGQRARQLMWNGSEKASGDRSVWGRLKLVE